MDFQYIDQLGQPNPELVSGSYGFISDLDAANRFGTDDLEEYSYWSWRSCGAACVSMLLSTFRNINTNLYDLVQKLVKKDGYLVNDGEEIGWKHQALVDELQDSGLESKIEPQLSLEDIRNRLEQGEVFIVSVTSRVIAGGSRMIVVYGLDDQNYLVADPYNLDYKGGLTTKTPAELELIFNGRGISVRP